MTKTHLTLKPSTNIVMIFLWGFLTGISAIMSLPYSLFIISVGAILGAIGGIMQYLALNESKRTLLDASTMLDIRKKMKDTKWGKRYIPFLWIGNLILVAFVIIMHRGDMPLEIMAGVFSLMFVREVITLRPTFELAKLSRQNPEQGASTDS